MDGPRRGDRNLDRKEERERWQEDCAESEPGIKRKAGCEKRGEADQEKVRMLARFALGNDRLKIEIRHRNFPPAVTACLARWPRRDP